MVGEDQCCLSAMAEEWRHLVWYISLRLPVVDSAKSRQGSSGMQQQYQTSSWVTPSASHPPMLSFVLHALICIIAKSQFPLLGLSPAILLPPVDGCFSGDGFCGNKDSISGTRLFFQKAVTFFQLLPWLWSKSNGVLCPLICCRKYHPKPCGVTWTVSSAGFDVSGVLRACVCFAVPLAWLNVSVCWSVQCHTVPLLHMLFRITTTEPDEGWKPSNDTVAPQMLILALPFGKWKGLNFITA